MVVGTEGSEGQTQAEALGWQSFPDGGHSLEKHKPPVPHGHMALMCLRPAGQGQGPLGQAFFPVLQQNG